MHLYRFIRSRIGVVYLKIKRVIGLIVAYILLKTLFKVPNQNLSIRLDTSRLSDGTGAQLQRILATRLISHTFKIGYSHQAIQKIQIHPLDPFQDIESYSKYLNELNERLRLVSTDSHLGESKEIVLNSLSLSGLIKFQFLSKYLLKKFTILLVDPYPISELLIKYFPSIKKYLVSDFWVENLPQEQLAIKVVVHHRQGVGGKAIYPGQKIARELDISYFIRILDQIKLKYEKCQSGDLQISIHTDAPQEEVIYSPPEDQLELWEGTPNFRDGKVLIIGASLKDIFLKHGYSVDVKSGGDPLDAILEMSQADYLITARSSLSYVGGVLNLSGKVFSAPGFWHQPLNNWIRGERIV